jgi:hypothetical protein
VREVLTWVLDRFNSEETFADVTASVWTATLNCMRALSLDPLSAPAWQE